MKNEIVSIINVKARTELPNDSFEAFVFIVFNEKTDIFKGYLKKYLYSNIDFGDNEISNLVNKHLPEKSHIKKNQLTYDLDKELMLLDIDIKLTEKQVQEIKDLINFK